VTKETTMTEDRATTLQEQPPVGGATDRDRLIAQAGPATARRVVVGVDGSESARAALRYAAQQAGASRAELVVLHAWEPPFEHVHGRQTARVLRTAAPQQATALLDDVLTGAREQDGWVVERVTALPVQGEASAVLLDAVRPGDLLVVGSGSGALRRLLLGSVSARVVQGTRSPVVVVPTPRRSRDGRRPAPRRPHGRSEPTALSAVRG
jgi:nucleotide-binding universal stress UspA family protein